MKTKLMTLSLLALVSLWACKREPVASVNPTYDPDANTVNTQFVLSISPATGNPDTKQTAVDVQASGTNFRGLVDAHLLTYALDYHGPGDVHYLYDVDNESSKAVRDYDLGILATSDNISEDDNRRVLELALPLGTNTILLYGRAPTTGTAETQGSVTYAGVALGTKLSNVTFKLNPRLADPDAFTQAGDLFGKMLTYIMNAGRYAETTANGNKSALDNTYKFWWPVDATSAEFPLTDAADSHPGYTLYSGTKKWKDYGDIFRDNPTTLKPLEEVLGEAYYQVMTLQGSDPKTELRAGASASIVRLVGDMFNIIKRVLEATPTTPEEYVATLVAQNIYTRAAYFFHYDDANSRIIFRTAANIKDGVDAVIPGRTTNYYSKINDSFFYYSKSGKKGGDTADDREEYEGFPMNLNMPSGSAIMEFSGVNVGTADEYVEVIYPETIPTYGMGAGARFPIANYRYPAELAYYTNSSIRVSDQAVERSDYPQVATNWTNSQYWNAAIWKGDEVLSTTRSVAVAKTVNYGTALLKAQFAFGASEIEDNNGGIHPAEANNKIAVNTGNKFQVTGIMIGGVDDEVGWDFLPKTGSFNKMIYDGFNNVPLDIPPYNTNPDKLYSDPVYTCTWDNYNATLGDNAQQKVYIGIELVNNTGEDIWGELNLIRNGGTFYLVGELDPTKEGVTDNLKKNGVVDLSRSDFFYPPFDATGKTINAPRVFMQDYVTSVKFKFAKDALKHAYVTMPDLRAGQVSLGLSVDLKWEKGMNFEVEMGNVTGN